MAPAPKMLKYLVLRCWGKVSTFHRCPQLYIYIWPNWTNCACKWLSSWVSIVLNLDGPYFELVFWEVWTLLGQHHILRFWSLMLSKKMLACFIHFIEICCSQGWCSELVWNFIPRISRCKARKPHHKISCTFSSKYVQMSQTLCWCTRLLLSKLSCGWWSLWS